MPVMHARFSRWMPPVVPKKLGIGGWTVLSAIVAALAYWLVSHPVGFVLTIGGLAVYTWVLERKRTSRALPVAQARQGEDVGTFARAFDRHASPPVDPWAIRAVWNAVHPLTELQGKRVALRPSDRFEEDLEIDPEEIEYLAPELVKQCERTMHGWEANPYLGQLNTVGGLVRFVSAQPKQG